MKVNWIEVTETSETGKQFCHGTFATDLPVGKDNIAELPNAPAPAGPWKTACSRN